MQLDRVVLVHGLWLGSWVFHLMGKRLTQAGFPVVRFQYRTTRADFNDNARTLARLLEGPNPVGVVAHSLGGLLTVAALNRLGTGTGRVVLLGTPLKGSAVARRIKSWPMGNMLLGHAADELGRGALAAPPVGWELGMIAGNRPIGAGVLAGGARMPGDGTVMLEETEADYLKDRRVIHETHTSLLLSRRAAALANEFLKHGRFSSVVY
jgi:pimeloyl-ACP methyl ester carboxylesterase